jgi:hypothetical protein
MESGGAHRPGLGAPAGHAAEVQEVREDPAPPARVFRLRIVLQRRSAPPPPRPPARALPLQALTRFISSNYTGGKDHGHRIGVGVQGEPHAGAEELGRGQVPFPVRAEEGQARFGARYGDKIMKKLSHIDHICLKQSYKIGSIELSESKFITANKKETVLSDTDTKITDCGPVKLASHHFPKNHMICIARYLRNSLRDMRWEYLSNRIHK